MKPVQIRNLTIGCGRPKICVPIVERTEEEILSFAEKITPESLTQDLRMTEIPFDAEENAMNATSGLPLMKKWRRFP